MVCYREAFVQASNLAFLWIFTGLWKVVWKTLSRFILLQKGTDFLGPEGICTWRYSSQQRVMLSILQTELFQICSCLGNLHPTEPGLQPELLNHFFHSCDAGWTKYGALERMADPSFNNIKPWDFFSMFVFLNLTGIYLVCMVGPLLHNPLRSCGL